MMAKAGLCPTNVFYLRVSNEEVFKRTQADSADNFECMRSILSQRIRYHELNTPHVLGFFQRYYNSLTEIDGSKSKWFMEDRAMQAIQSNMHARQQFARSMFLKQPCLMHNLNMDRCLVKSNLSQFGYFCPVSWKNTK
jgi:hypothetical protein